MRSDQKNGGGRIHSDERRGRGVGIACAECFLPRVFASMAGKDEDVEYNARVKRLISRWAGSKGAGRTSTNKDRRLRSVRRIHTLTKHVEPDQNDGGAEFVTEQRRTRVAARCQVLVARRTFAERSRTAMAWDLLTVAHCLRIVDRSAVAQPAYLRRWRAPGPAPTR